jgi:hypothetical protein
MTLTAADAQALVLLEVGAGLDGTTPAAQAALDRLTPNAQLVWDSYAFKAYHPGLQAAWFKRKCLDILLGQLRLKANTTLGPLSRQLGAQWDHLLAMRKEATADIADLERRAARARGPVGGRITQEASLSPADLAALQTSDEGDDFPDPNHPRYLGIPGLSGSTRFP